MAKTFTKLTRPEMRKLAPGGKINEHGITFEKSATGDGVFTVNIMADGQRIHRVVGRRVLLGPTLAPSPGRIGRSSGASWCRSRGWVSW